MMTMIIVNDVPQPQQDEDETVYYYGNTISDGMASLWCSYFLFCVVSSPSPHHHRRQHSEHHSFRYDRAQQSRQQQQQHRQQQPQRSWNVWSRRRIIRSLAVLLLAVVVGVGVPRRRRPRWCFIPLRGPSGSRFLPWPPVRQRPPSCYWSTLNFMTGRIRSGPCRILLSNGAFNPTTPSHSQRHGHGPLRP